ncbi:AAA family ATPase [Segatella buccae]|uniref:AAA family ATPase n=1 Tax=Segatella buccae TaxID=28126 RepID=UPI00065FE69A|nr:AAA family ATPase [Segatella buccae]
MKHLVIRHFGPIKEVDMDLRRVNIIIGPQSSGKSTILKIACFCDWMERQIELTQNPDKYCDSNFFIENLIGFHKLEGYLQQETYIRYENDAVSFDYSEKNKKCTFKWNEAKRWKYKRTKIAYIPAERNLVAAIPNWYQVNMNKDNILDFMKEWEFARKAFLKGEQILDLPAKYEYNAYNQGDRIKLENGKELDLTVASSGLQALTPLYVMLRYLTSEYYKEAHTNVEQDMLRQNLHEVVAKECAGLTKGEQQNIIDTILTPHHTDLFVEEPEAHIFPSTQKSFVYSLVEILNGNVQHTCFLATHSPYILTAFNNIILAGETMAMSKEKADKVSVIMPKRQTLCYDEVAAFEMSNGRNHSIMDEDFRLISADAIDAASQEISNDFDYLLNI